MPRETQKPGGMLRPVCFTQRYQGVIVSSAANKKEECVIDNTCITRLAQGRQSSCHGTPFSLRERLYDRNWERERCCPSFVRRRRYSPSILFFCFVFKPPSKNDYFSLFFVLWSRSAGGRAGKTAGSVRLRGLASGRVVGRDGRTLRRWLVSETPNFYFSHFNLSKRSRPFGDFQFVDKFGHQPAHIIFWKIECQLQVYVDAFFFKKCS